MARTVVWSGIIGAEGRPTGDGRYIENDALHWEDLPLVLRYSAEDNGGHDGAVVVGTIDEITRADDGMIHAGGRFDMDSPQGVEAYRQVSEGLTTGVSFDLDDVSFEIRVSSEVADQIESDQADPVDGPMPAGLERNDDGTATVVSMKPDDEVQWVTEARVRAATIVAIPAFTEARIESAKDQVVEDTADPEAIAASGYRPPPAQWFADPALTGPTPLRVTEAGRVYGHIALWDSCHTGLAGCTTPPESNRNYGGFLLGAVRCDDGTEVAVGHITLGTGHAGPKLTAAAAIRHYDDTGTQVANVAAGDDEYGIWVAGQLCPGVTPEQVVTLRSSPPSGDWRRLGTGLELIAVLSVNVPGFPVPRVAARVNSGRTVALVAAGMLLPDDVRTDGLTGSDLALLRSMAARERRAEGSRLARSIIVMQAPSIRRGAKLIAARIKTGVKL